MTTPHYNPALDHTPLSVFEGIVRAMKLAHAPKPIPLHQGKTSFTTPVELREWGADEFDYPAHHDGPTCGTASLIEAVRNKLEAQHGRELDGGRISITVGITHGLSLAFHAVLRPGDEVIVLSPQWLFTNGLVRAAGGVPVEVPVFLDDRGGADELRARVAAAVGPRTRAIYFNTPNNPSGRRLSAAELSVLAELASAHELWLVSDDAYEAYDFTPEGFVSLEALPGAEGRTFSAYSFSKTYGLTGYRIGYLVSPPTMAERVRKFGLHSIYSVPTCCQFVALSALRRGPGAIRDNVELVRRARDLTLEHLRVPATRPSGGFYALLDLGAWEPGVDDFIARCIARGVSLAPGRAFGASVERYARLCFSVVGHEDLIEGIGMINEVYEQGP